MSTPTNATRRIGGGFLGFVGYMLSPLSWWNDLFVNVPLAIGFAWLVALFDRRAFVPAAVIGYWLTNVLGFVLMHKGTVMALAKHSRPAFSWRSLAVDVGISLAYTILIVVLIQMKWVQPPEGLLHH